MEIDYQDKYTTNCFVAALDIMGFKTIVESESPRNIYSIFSSIVSEIHYYFDKENTGMNITAKIFSDSIFLITKDGSSESFSSIVIAAAHFQNLLFKQGIALNGAIAYGEVTCDSENDIFYGKAINDAHILQEKLYCYCIALDETANERRQEIMNIQLPECYKSFPDLIIDCEIPLKCNKNKKAGAGDDQRILSNQYFVNSCEKLVPFGVFEDQKDAFKQLLTEYYDSNKSKGDKVVQYIQNTEIIYQNWFNFTSEHSACSGWGEQIIP